MSNCLILPEPFKYQSWTNSRPKAGMVNDCSGHVDPLPTPVCESQHDCTDMATTSQDTDTACAEQYTLQIQNHYYHGEPSK